MCTHVPGFVLIFWSLPSSASAGATHFTLIHSILARPTQSAKLLNTSSPITHAFFPTPPTSMGTRLNGVGQPHLAYSRELTAPR